MGSPANAGHHRLVTAVNGDSLCTVSDTSEEFATSTLTCFVIGPIGNRLAPVGSIDRTTYEEALLVVEDVISPACARFGLVPVRADSLGRAGEINEQIFRRLRDDDVVIADLTGANPNVMYELGLRHTREKLTVQIGEFGQLPFDVNNIRTIQFSRSDAGLIRARNDLIEVLEAGLRDDFDQVTATRIWCERADQPAIADLDEDGAGSVPREAPSQEDDRGFIDILAEAEGAADDLTAALGEIGACTERAAELATQSTEELQQSDAAGKGMRGRLQVLTRYANGLSEIADDLEPLVDRYLQLWDRTADGSELLVEQMERDPATKAVGGDLGMMLRRAAASTRESMSATAEFVSTLRESGRASKVLKPPTQRMSQQLDRLIGSVERMDGLDRRLQILGIPLPPEDWTPEQTEAEQGLDRASPKDETLPS